MRAAGGMMKGGGEGLGGGGLRLEILCLAHNTAAEMKRESNGVPLGSQLLP